MCIQSTKYTYVYLKVFLRVPSRMRLFPSDGSSGSQQRECQQRGFPADGLRSFHKRSSRQRHSRRGGSQKRRSPLRASGVPRRGDPSRGIHGFPEVEIPAEGFRGFQKMRSRQRDTGFPTRGDSKQRGSPESGFSAVGFRGSQLRVSWDPNSSGSPKMELPAEGFGDFQQTNLGVPRKGDSQQTGSAGPSRRVQGFPAYRVSGSKHRGSGVPNRGI